MKTTLTFMLLALASAAHGNTVPGVPAFDVDCPGKIMVHADQDGPVMINSKEAQTKMINDRLFEAKGPDVTISISIADDDSVAVTYTSKKGGNGICQSVDD